MSENKKYLMVRAARYEQFCIENQCIVFGWSDFNLSESENIDEIYEKVKELCVKGSPQPSMVRKFASIRQGDIIILPAYGLIHIGIAESSPQYNEEWKEYDSANYAKVDWQKTCDRNNLSSAFQRKLKFRMTINDNLWEYEEEIEYILQSSSDLFDRYQQKIKSNAQEVEKNIAEHINNPSNIHFQDAEFELFIMHLFELNFPGMVSEKNNPKNEAQDGKDFTMRMYLDDILDTGIQLNIQVKQHQGDADLSGIDQIQKSIVSDENTRNVLVTTGKETPEIKEKAKQADVCLYCNKEIARMIIDNFEEIDKKYKPKLNLYNKVSILK